MTDDLHEHAARAYTNLGAGQVRNRPLAGRRPGPARRHRVLLRARPRRLGSVHDRRGSPPRCSSRAGMRQRRSWPTGDPEPERAAGQPHTRARRGRAPSRVRRGDRRLHDRLDEARDLAAGTGEVQRIMPVALARAEAAWTRRRPRRRRRELAPLDAFPADLFLRLGAGGADWWRRTVGIDVPARTSVPEPFARMADGDWLGGSSGVGAARLPVVAGRLPGARRVRRRRSGGHRAARRDRRRRRPARPLLRDRRGPVRWSPAARASRPEPTPPGSPPASSRCWPCSPTASPTPSWPTASSSPRRPSTTTSPRCCASSASRTEPRPPPPRDSRGLLPNMGNDSRCAPLTR